MLAYPIAPIDRILLWRHRGLTHHRTPLSFARTANNGNSVAAGRDEGALARGRHRVILRCTSSPQHASGHTLIFAA
jgi:hypothetical protein